MRYSEVLLLLCSSNAIRMNLSGFLVAQRFHPELFFKNIFIPKKNKVLSLHLSAVVDKKLMKHLIANNA